MAEDTSPPATPRRPRRSRPAAELDNSIAPLAVVRETPAPPPAARQATESTPATVADPPATPGSVRGFAAVPDHILDRYYRIRHEFFLDNGELAFVNQGEQLTTRSENREIVRDLVHIAHHNGYTAIAVTGTERFRREAWAQATHLGLEVEGYTPTEHDKKQWVRAAARENARPIAREAPEADGPPPQASPTAGPAADPAPRVPESLRPQDSAAQHALHRPPEPAPEGARHYVGELLDHGPDHYQHNPREELSYFVKLKTARGELELWGLDLKRALAEAKSSPRIGDPVGIIQTGQHAVTVRSRLFDAAGQFLGEEDKATHRNQWQIEKREFFDERAQLAQVLRDPHITPQEGGHRHPQLVGTYFVLKEAEEFAKQAYRTAPERESFLALMRERLAQEIERGAALRTTQIRDRARSVEKQVHDLRAAFTPPDPRRRPGPEPER